VSTSNPTWTGLGLNLGFCGERLVINHPDTWKNLQNSLACELKVLDAYVFIFLKNNQWET